MMFSRYLSSSSKIMAKLGNQQNLSDHMASFAIKVQNAITRHGVVKDQRYGDVYAFEVDGYGSGKAKST